MNISKIGEQILEICGRKDSNARKDRQELWEWYSKIDDERRHLAKNEENIDALLSLHRQLFEVRNRKASYWEHEIGRMLINHIPHSIRWKDKEIPEDNEAEILKEHYTEDENARPALHLSAKILRYAKEVIATKPDKTKRYKKRVTEALRWIDNLHHFYIIEDVKDIYMEFVHDKDEDLQFFALVGLESYFAYKHAKKITRKEIKIFEDIIKTTTSRYNSRAASKILFSARKINKFGALDRIDNWEETDWD